VGGSCPNVNCLPSKNEICSAKVAELVHRGADSGFRRIVPHRTWWLFKSENARWLKG
jgi:pyruvate/2-oxoglutarate dehydrogenase complex dihydrolipoamide dehydrogenase (E3) component